jgi:hypothetical protein
LKSRKELDFEEAKAALYLLCDICKIPMPNVKKIDASGYEAEYTAMEVRFKEKTDFEAVVHEWLHHVFRLVFLEKLGFGERNDYTLDESDNYEHRVIIFLEPILARELSKLYKKVLVSLKRGR